MPLAAEQRWHTLLEAQFVLNPQLQAQTEPGGFAAGRLGPAGPGGGAAARRGAMAEEKEGGK
jgi:hypothetical protein